MTNHHRDLWKVLKLCIAFPLTPPHGPWFWRIYWPTKQNLEVFIQATFKKLTHSCKVIVNVFPNHWTCFCYCRWIWFTTCCSNVKVKSTFGTDSLVLIHYRVIFSHCCPGYLTGPLTWTNICLKFKKMCFCVLKFNISKLHQYH